MNEGKGVPGGWGNYPTDEGIHVMPIDDDQPHKPCLCCPCSPVRAPYPNDAVILHNAWDKRL